MKTLKEIHSEANKYSESEPLQDAFVAGARWALTGKYYKPSELFNNHAEVETVDLEVEEEQNRCWSSNRLLRNGGMPTIKNEAARRLRLSGRN